MVKQLKRLVDNKVLGLKERQRLTTNRAAEKVYFLQSKLVTVEKHLPAIVHEILEYYFDKKTSDLVATLVDQKTFKEAMHGKLNINIFEAYEKQVASDRSREY